MDTGRSDSIESLIAPRGADGVRAMQPKATPAANEAALPLPIEGTLPPLDGAVEWLNSPPLTAAGLRGKVVVIDFWTYSCVNCLRTLPYVRAWYEKYKDQGLVVIGVHAPEFAFEKDIGNVRRAVKDLKVDYPVAIDNDYAIWRAFDNRYWPAHYFIDAEGRIRHHHFGEGEYAESEAIIQKLLAEAGAQHVASGTVEPDAGGIALAAENAMQSPETYIGYDRAENFTATAVRDREHEYSIPPTLATNQWGLDGTWTIAEESAKLARAGGRIAFRFHARDVNLVLGPADDGKPVRYRVTIDGKAPGENRGVDSAADGSGEVTSQRLYQLVRAKGDVADRTFEIEFLDPGVEAFAFTFG
jgi:thiol-disulfide isomerase/thioredoxin